MRCCGWKRFYRVAVAKRQKNNVPSLSSKYLPKMICTAILKFIEIKLIKNSALKEIDVKAHRELIREFDPWLVVYATKLLTTGSEYSRIGSECICSSPITCIGLENCSNICNSVHGARNGLLEKFVQHSVRESRAGRSSEQWEDMIKILNSEFKSVGIWNFCTSIGISRYPWYLVEGLVDASKEAVGSLIQLRKVHQLLSAFGYPFEVSGRVFLGSIMLQVPEADPKAIHSREMRKIDKAHQLESLNYLVNNPNRNGTKS
ncbi:hypothetical protein VNO77_41965 [Canavalia gladiata]|uniref:Uncharacterized protein n=1 Tax=Canavalia gladiata TaxID=3824 RepID=A0AAN9K0R6_CANGL